MTIEILHGDCEQVVSTLPEKSINTVVTSPPYWGLRNYQVDGQLGLEASPEEYAQKLVDVFAAIRPALRDDGTIWLNIGDCYARSNTTRPDNNISTPGRSGIGNIPKSQWKGLPAKNLIGIPWKVAFAMQADGWHLRSDIIWSKPNPTPESVKDRPTRAHEYIFLFSKSQRYYYDADAVREPYVSDFSYAHPGGRNKRTVWTVTPKPFKEAHFAVYPPDLIEPCIKAGCPEGGTVLDPFFGAGTTGLVAESCGRNTIGVELNKDYITIARKRLGLIPDALTPFLGRNKLTTPQPDFV